LLSSLALALFIFPMSDPYRPPIAPADTSTSLALVPSHDQVPVLYVIVVYAVVIFALWNIPGARNLINPLKLFTIGWHELCHIIMVRSPHLFLSEPTLLLLLGDIIGGYYT